MIVIMLFIVVALLVVAADMMKTNKELRKGLTHMEKTIYCGDEYTAEFLINALKLLEFGARYEIDTIDGEYVVEVKR